MNTCTFSNSLKIIGWLTVLVFFLTSSAVKADPRYEQVWYAGYTGEQLLIDFKTTTPTVRCKDGVGARVGFESGAVWTDSLGKLYLYTDGQNLYNGQTHGIISNRVGADPSTTQPALIVPKPGDSSLQKFYVFTNSTDVDAPRPPMMPAIGVIQYHDVDLTQTPDGKVTASTILGTWNAGEALGFAPHTNGTDFWILLLDSKAKIRAYQVSSAGVNTTPIESLTPYMGAALRASIVLSPNQNRLAISLEETFSTGQIITAAFDRTTGIITDFKTHVTGDVGYSVEWSPNGNRLYYSNGKYGFYGVPAFVDITTNAIFPISTMTGFGGVKLAKDGKIYFTGDKKTEFLVVNDPDTTTPTTSTLSAGGCILGFNILTQTGAPSSLNTPPLITSHGGASNVTIALDENISAVTTVTAIDGDPNDVLGFRILGGSDAALFTMEPQTGELIFKTAPDFENPADIDKNNVYEVVVQVVDSRGGTSTQTFTITINDVDDDNDDDGLVDSKEILLGTDPKVKDTDGDGLNDGAEVGPDGIYTPGVDTDPLDADSDDDGLKDSEEKNGTGLLNGKRLDPLKGDTDGDGLSDGLEVGNTQPVVGGQTVNGIVFKGTDRTSPNYKIDADPTTKTDPSQKDTDNDGMSDGEEDINKDGHVQNSVGGTNSQGSGETDPANADTDGDGLKDGDEKNGTGPLNGKKTNPLDIDTDDGGINDGAEVLNDRTDPTVESDDKVDSDGDGISNVQEIELGTNPNNADSDEDGIKDNIELTEDGKGFGPFKKVDIDGDGTIDALDTDSDNDSVPDVREGIIDTDADGKPDWRDVDDDNDTIPTKQEIDDAKIANLTEDVDLDGRKNWLDFDANNDQIKDGDQNTDVDKNNVKDYLQMLSKPSDRKSLEGGAAGCSMPLNSQASLTTSIAFGLGAAIAALLRRRRRL